MWCFQDEVFPLRNYGSSSSINFSTYSYSLPLVQLGCDGDILIESSSNLEQSISVTPQFSREICPESSVPVTVSPNKTIYDFASVHICSFS